MATKAHKIAAHMLKTASYIKPIYVYIILRLDKDLSIENYNTGGIILFTISKSSVYLIRKKVLCYSLAVSKSH